MNDERLFVNSLLSQEYDQIDNPTIQRAIQCIFSDTANLQEVNGELRVFTQLCRLLNGKIKIDIMASKMTLTVKYKENSLNLSFSRELFDIFEFYETDVSAYALNASILEQVKQYVGLERFMQILSGLDLSNFENPEDLFEICVQCASEPLLVNLTGHFSDFDLYYVKHEVFRYFNLREISFSNNEILVLAKNEILREYISEEQRAQAFNNKEHGPETQLLKFNIEEQKQENKANFFVKLKEQINEYFDFTINFAVNMSNQEDSKLEFLSLKFQNRIIKITKECGYLIIYLSDKVIRKQLIYGNVFISIMQYEGFFFIYLNLKCITFQKLKAEIPVSLELQNACITGLQIFTYAISFLTQFYCYNELPSICEIEWPVFDVNCANNMIYRKYAETGLVLDADYGSEALIEMKRSNRTVFLEDETYEITKCGVTGYLPVYNSKYQIKKEFDQELLFYGYLGLDVKQAGIYQFDECIEEVGGQLHIFECTYGIKKCITFGELETFNSEEECTLTSPENMFEHAWHNNKFELITDDLIVELINQQSKYLIFSVLCDPQYNFCVNIAIFKGLCCEEETQNILCILEAIIERIDTPEKQQTEFHLQQENILNIYYELPKSFNFNDNAKSVVRLAVSMLNEYQGEEYFNIAGLLLLIQEKLNFINEEYLSLRYIQNIIANTEILFKANKAVNYEKLEVLCEYAPYLSYLILQNVQHRERSNINFAALFSFLEYVNKEKMFSNDIIRKQSIFDYSNGQNIFIIVEALFLYFERTLPVNYDFALEIELRLIEFVSNVDCKSLEYLLNFDNELFTNILIVAVMCEFKLFTLFEKYQINADNQVLIAQIKINENSALSIVNIAAQNNKLPYELLKLLLEAKEEGIKEEQMYYIKYYFCQKLRQDSFLFDEIIMQDATPSNTIIEKEFLEFESSLADIEQTPALIEQQQIFSISFEVWNDLLELIEKFSYYEILGYFFKYFTTEFAYYASHLLTEQEEEFCALLQDSIRSEPHFDDLIKFISLHENSYVNATKSFSQPEFDKLIPIQYNAVEQASQRPKSCFSYFEQRESLIKYWRQRGNNAAFEQHAQTLIERLGSESYSFGALMDRKISLNQFVFHQIHVSGVEEQSDHAIAPNLQYFVPPCQCVVAVFEVVLQSKTDINGISGLLVVTNAALVYVPYCHLSALAFPLVDLTNAASREELHVVAEHFEYENEFFLAGSNCELLFDKDIRQSFNNQIVLPLERILCCNQQFESHRKNQLEVVLSNGYSFSFNFQDQFNSSRKSDTKVISEFQCGIFNHLLHQMGVQVAGEVYRPVIIRQLEETALRPYQLCAVNKQSILNPACVHDAAVRQQLNDFLDKAVEDYNGIQRRYVISQLQELQQKQHLVFPVFEPFESETTVLNQILQNRPKELSKYLTDINGINGTEGSISIMSQIIYVFFINGIISNYEFILMLNFLSGCSINDLTNYPIIPICKNRNFQLPPQCEVEQRLDETIEKYQQLSQVNQIQMETPLDYFNLQIPLHGTFPSNSASGLYYNCRQQGYASALIKLQNGKFDAPDRMFYNYDGLYKIVFKNNFKEHTTDLLLLQNYFNTYEFDIGKRTNGKLLNDVSFSTDSEEVETTITEPKFLEPNSSYLITKNESENNSLDNRHTRLRSSIQNYVDSDQEVSSNVEETEEVDIQQEQLLSSQDNAENAQVSNELTEIQTSSMQDLKTEIEANKFTDYRATNPFDCTDNIFKELQETNREEILEWVRLYFGSEECNAEHLNCYNSPVYLLRIIDEQSIRQEIQCTKFFGQMPEKLFNGPSKYYRKNLLLLNYSSLQVKEGAYRFSPSTFLAQLQKFRNSKPGYIKLNKFPYAFEFDNYSVDYLHTNIVELNTNGIYWQINVESVVEKIMRSYSYLLVETAENLQLFKAEYYYLRHILTLPIKVQCSGISVSQIIYFCTAREIIAFDGLNDQVLSVVPQTIEDPYEIELDGFENVYIRNKSQLFIYSPDLVQLGEFAINQLDVILPLHDRFKMLKYSLNSVSIFEFSSKQGDIVPIYKQEAPPGRFFKQCCCERDQSVDIVNNATCKQMLKYDCLEMKELFCQQFKSNVKQVRSYRYSILVETFDDSVYSIMNK